MVLDTPAIDRILNPETAAAVKSALAVLDKLNEVDRDFAIRAIFAIHTVNCAGTTVVEMVEAGNAPDEPLHETAYEIAIQNADCNTTNTDLVDMINELYTEAG